MKYLCFDGNNLAGFEAVKLRQRIVVKKRNLSDLSVRVFDYMLNGAENGFCKRFHNLAAVERIVILNHDARLALVLLNMNGCFELRRVHFKVIAENRIAVYLHLVNNAELIFVHNVRRIAVFCTKLGVGIDLVLYRSSENSLAPPNEFKGGYVLNLDSERKSFDKHAEAVCEPYIAPAVTDRAYVHIPAVHKS